MGLVKDKMMQEQAGHYEDSTGLVAFSGGYLDIQVDGETIGTVSIPVPNFMAERHRDSMVSWYEELQDNDGNIYKAEIYSSMYGVDWTVDVEPYDDGRTTSDEILHNLYGRIKINIVLTDQS